MATKSQSTSSVVKKTADSLMKDLPKLVKENKGAAVGAVVGYLLADKLQETEGLIPALLGGLIGHEVDEKKAEKEF